MGCSSVALRPRGAYHATGAALLWLCAGAPCVVGNLWDVTDGDLDLLTHELFRVWLEHGSGNSSSGSGAFSAHGVRGYSSVAREDAPSSSSVDSDAAHEKPLSLGNAHSYDASINSFVLFSHN